MRWGFASMVLFCTLARTRAWRVPPAGKATPRVANTVVETSTSPLFGADASFKGGLSHAPVRAICCQMRGVHHS
jgi:hypothetical protein